MVRPEQWSERAVAAVTFDLDFTLWDLSGVIERAEAATQEYLSANFPRLTERFPVEALRDMRMALATERPDLAHDVTRLRKETMRRAGEAAGYRGGELERLVEESFAVMLAHRHDVVLYPDTERTLDALHGRVKLGAITNGNAEIRRMDLGRYFDFAVSAMDVGAAKPSHLVFDTACRRGGVVPGEVVHVGDDVYSDVYGAATNGLRAVWLNRTGEPWPKDVEPVPHVEITSLDELLQHV
ncbi:MAG: HAD-IA family hydrolase [Ectothiorhodospiraceae bacterium]|jgi:putative hydrolase of the HAD superfamily